MLQNTDQRGDEDDRAQNLQEEERQTFVVHFTEDKVGPFVGESEQFFEHLGEAFHKTQTNVGVQEEPRKQNFNDQQLNNITNTNFLRSVLTSNASAVTTTSARTK
jgi:hypothetical protein